MRANHLAPETETAINGADVHGFQQNAIWIVTDNPAREGFTPFTGSRAGPTPGELDEIRMLFAGAGIDPQKYEALR